MLRRLQWNDPALMLVMEDFPKKEWGIRHDEEAVFSWADRQGFDPPLSHSTRKYMCPANRGRTRWKDNDSRKSRLLGFYVSRTQAQKLQIWRVSRVYRKPRSIIGKLNMAAWMFRKPNVWRPWKMKTWSSRRSWQIRCLRQQRFESFFQKNGRACR